MEDKTLSIHERLTVLEAALSAGNPDDRKSSIEVNARIESEVRDVTSRLASLQIQVTATGNLLAQQQADFVTMQRAVQKELDKVGALEQRVAAIEEKPPQGDSGTKRRQNG